MIVKELILEDSYGRRLVIGTFAGQIIVLPVVKKIGDMIALNEDQARLLLLYLQDHVEPETRFDAEGNIERRRYGIVGESKT